MLEAVGLGIFMLSATVVTALLEYTENNSESYDRSEQRWIEILQSIKCGQAMMPKCSYFVEAGKTYTGKLSIAEEGRRVSH